MPIPSLNITFCPSRLHHVFKPIEIRKKLNDDVANLSSKKRPQRKLAHRSLKNFREKANSWCLVVFWLQISCRYHWELTYFKRCELSFLGWWKSGDKLIITLGGCDT